MFIDINPDSNLAVFPLIQLPRKSEVITPYDDQEMETVSINSTSEEVRSGPDPF